MAGSFKSRTEAIPVAGAIPEPPLFGKLSSKTQKRKSNSSNARNEAEMIAGCPLAAAVALLGGRWKLLILWYVSHNLARFSELRRTIPGVSEKMLHQQLRELERTGLLVRVVEGRRVRYSLTALGMSVQAPLRALEAWSAENRIGERLLQRNDLAASPLDSGEAASETISIKVRAR